MKVSREINYALHLRSLLFPKSGMTSERKSEAPTVCLFPGILSATSMPSIRTRNIWIIAAMVFLACGGIYWSERSKSDVVEGKIRSRYEQMRTAISAADVVAAEALFAPGDFAKDKFDRLGTFAKPLRPDARIRISNSVARIYPTPVRHYGVIPGGDSVEMIEIGGEWFFTGKVNID